MRVRNHRRLVSSGASLMPDSGQLAERELQGAPERKRTVPLPSELGHPSHSPRHVPVDFTPRRVAGITT